MPVIEIENVPSLCDYVGREVAVSEWLEITQDRIQQFADVTEDRQWIHTDLIRAQNQSPFGTIIAHGFLTLSLISSLMSQSIAIRNGVKLTVNYGLNRVRFISPVKAGSQIRAHFTLQSIEEVQQSWQATWLVLIESQDSDKPVCIAEWVLRYYTSR